MATKNLLINSVRGGLCGSVAIDPVSFDAAKGFCTVAYYASPLEGLFRSEDGGVTWKAVSRQPIGMNNEANVPPFLKVHPTRGLVYLGGKGGFFSSDDGGKTFDNLWDAVAVWGLSVVPGAPDEVFLSGETRSFRSQDAGKTFAALPAKGIARGEKEQIRNINVSPADPKRMLCWVAGENWKWVRYWSHGGGATFSPSKIDTGLAAREGQPNAADGGLATLPYNVRNGFSGWHPTDPNIVYGGKTFQWWNNGINGIMVGTSFNFSPHDAKTVFLGFQDYNGAFTTMVATMSGAKSSAFTLH